jgi:hypothetical protein
VQHAQDGVVAQRLPVGLALARALEVTPGEGQPGAVERLDDGGGRSGGLERREQAGDGAADGGIGVEDDVPGRVVGQPDRQRRDELAAAGLGQLPAAQPGLDEMELSLLCGLLRYADQSTGAPRRAAMTDRSVRHNHSPSRNASMSSAGW